MALINMFPSGSESEGGGAKDDSKVVKKDVYFYDYDGTPLYAYTLAEANALTQLPVPLQHDGLIFQGWNYTLNEVQNLTRPMDIGALYITDDGRTRLVIRLEDESRTLVPLVFALTNSKGIITIDWGDGNVETASSTQVKTVTHQYAAPGEYTISLDVTGAELKLGNGDDSVLDSLYKGTLHKVFMGSGITGISTGAFSKCRLLTEVSLTTDILRFEKLAFFSCHSLRAIVIPSGTTEILDGAFQACRSIQMVSLPNSLTKLDRCAYADCNALSSIQIPDNVATIGEKALQYCYSLKSIKLPKKITTVGKDLFCYSHALTTVEFPVGITAIGSYAFSPCPSLASVVIPEGVESIGDSAFALCYALTSVTLPAGLKTIGIRAFDTCDSLATLTIPESVTDIKSSAFRTSAFMGSYHFKSIVPPTLADNDVFRSLPASCVIYVPVGSLEAYQTADIFSAYADRIQEEPA